MLGSVTSWDRDWPDKVPVLAGVPLSEPMDVQQRAWLRSTIVPLRSIAFCSRERASHHMDEQVWTLPW